MFSHRSRVMARYLQAQLVVVVLFEALARQSCAADATVSPSLSLGDIVAAVESRQSASRGYAITFKCTNECTDDYFRLDRLMKLLSEGRAIQEAITDVKQCDIGEVVAQSDRGRTLVEAYDVLVSADGQVAASMYNSDDLLLGKRIVQYRFVFDGTKTKSLNCSSLVGGVATGSRDDCLPTKMPEHYLYITGKPLMDLLQDESIELVGTRALGGDVLCDLRKTISSDVVLTTIDIAINLSKGAWPVMIRETSRDKKSGAIGGMTICQIVSFHESKSLSYPARIARERFGSAFLFGYPTEMLLEKDVCEIERFEVAPAVSDATFTLEFPNGTGYLDDDTGEQFFITADGKTITHEERLRQISEANKDRFHAEPPPPAPSRKRRVVLVALALTLMSFAAANACMRKYRVRIR